MKRRYFIHVLIILVLVASLLIVFTSGALGKYTNVGLGVFSTLAFVNFSNYDVVGGVIVDDEINDNNTITPTQGENTSGSLWGPGDAINNESHNHGYGWDDAGDISFAVTNECDKTTVYLTFVVRMALPQLWLTNFEFDYKITAIPVAGGSTIESEGTLRDDDFNRIRYLFNGGVFELYSFYLEEVEIDTQIQLKPGDSYQCHIQFSGLTTNSGELAQLFSQDSAYHSIAIKARTEL